MSYTVLDDEGNGVVACGEERAKEYEARGRKIVRHDPTRQAIKKWEAMQKRKQELTDLYARWSDQGLLFKRGKTATDVSDDLISSYQDAFNKTINEILNACVGKAVIL